MQQNDLAASSTGRLLLERYYCGVLVNGILAAVESE